MMHKVDGTAILVVTAKRRTQMTALALPPRGTLTGTWDAETKAWFGRWLDSWQVGYDPVTNDQLKNYSLHMYLTAVSEFYEKSVRNEPEGRLSYFNASDFLPSAETIYEILLDRNPSFGDGKGSGKPSLVSFLRLLAKRNELSSYEILDYIIANYAWASEDWTADIWEPNNFRVEPKRYLPLLASNPSIPTAHLDELVERYSAVSNTEPIYLSVARLAGLVINPSLSRAAQLKLSGYLDGWIADEKFKEDREHRYLTAGSASNLLTRIQGGTSRSSGFCHPGLTCHNRWPFNPEEIAHDVDLGWKTSGLDLRLQQFYSLFTCSHLDDEQGLRVRVIERVLERLSSRDTPNPVALVFLASPALLQRQKLITLHSELDASVPIEWLNLLT